MKCAGRSSTEFEYLQRLVGSSGLLGGLFVQPNNTALSPSASSLTSCRWPSNAVGEHNTTSPFLISDPLDGATIVCSLLADSAESTPTVGGLGSDVAPPAAAYSLVEEVLYTRVIPLVCLFGIVGNCLNLFALTSMIVAHRTPMDRMERSATVGLLALAVSDLFFCIAVVPLAFVEQVDGETVPPPDHLTISLVYQVYHSAVIGLCITLSTWLTVVMAVSRYLAICRPLHARSIIGLRFAVETIVAALVVSVVLNIPRFLYEDVACVELQEPPINVAGGGKGDSGGAVRYFYFPFPGFLRRHGWLDQAYHALYLIVGIAVPLTALAYCNFFLIRAIRRSTQLRRQFQQPTCDGSGGGIINVTTSHGRDSKTVKAQCARLQQQQQQQPQQQQQQHRLQEKRSSMLVVVVDDGTNCSSGKRRRQTRHGNDSTNVITLTMTIIVIMNVVMVSPSEISNIFTQMINAHLQQEEQKQSANSDESSADSTSMLAYNIAVAIGNTLQTLNFACNFVLYCVVNVQFRRILRHLVTCKQWWDTPSTQIKYGGGRTEVSVSSVSLHTAGRSAVVPSPRFGCRRDEVGLNRLRGVADNSSNDKGAKNSALLGVDNGRVTAAADGRYRGPSSVSTVDRANVSDGCERSTNKMKTTKYKFDTSDLENDNNAEDN